MGFWADWALWQKLSVALAILIAVVLIYSFGILVYNRRTTKKHAEAEESERVEKEIELHPMLTDASYIPFGARALERGIQVEGIWVSNNNTPLQSPHQPGTPVVSRPPSPTLDSPLKPGPANVTSNAQMPTVASPMPFHIKSPEPQRNPRVGVDIVGKDDRREGFPHDQFRANQYPRLVATGRNEPRTGNAPELHPGKKNPRSSWISKSPAETWKRSSAADGHSRRRSSEEFRRRMSKLFDENVPTPPMETFQLNPLHGVPTNYRRKSSLGAPPV